MGKKDKKKQAASSRKQPISQKEYSYLRKCAENSVTAVFGGRKPLAQ